MIIGVIGGNKCSPEIENLAFEVGKKIVEKGGIVVCGGLGGVMESVARGAKERGGVTVGILPGKDKETANPYIDIPIVTDMGVARNVILVRTADALIAINGSYGTLSEIAIALNIGKPVVGLHTWDLKKAGEVESELFLTASTADEAIEKVLKFILRR
jgi:hypothetical protein